MLAITEELGRFEEFFSDVVYPVWPLWLALAIAVLVAASYAAYRLGWHRVAREHRIISGLAAVAILAVAIPVGYYTISPLFERSLACEASPIAGAGAGSEECEERVASMTTAPALASPRSAETPPAGDGGGAAFEPRVAYQGEFRGADDFHFGEGKAVLIETAPEQYILRFEEFSVRNGPDLFAYLSTNPEGYSEDGINLGELKATDGAFNYDVPAGTDVSKFKSAIVWCKQFGVLFAVAPLTAT